MKRKFLALLGSLGGALAVISPADAAPAATGKPTIGRIIALPPAPEQPQAAAPAEPMRFAGNSSSNNNSNSSRNSSRNRSNNSSSNNNSNSGDDDDRRGKRWR
jgi:hypothetical protein